MKIMEVRCFRRTLQLREPYSISYESVDRCDNLFLHLITGEGFEGWGCAAPDPAVTGETPEGSMAAAEANLVPLLTGRDPFSYARIMEDLVKSIPDKPTVRTMADMALFDLLAQKAGVPLFRFLGGYRRSIPTSVTIGIMPEEETIRTARAFVEKGYRILKVKGGREVQADIRKINRIRETLGKRIRIRFDANQGYNLEDSIRFMEGTREAGIELFEQPTIRSDQDLLRQVTLKSPVPVMADESLLSLSDVFKLSRNRCTDLINIKLMKTGGILEAMHINSVAKAAGIGVMVGCMDESSLGIAGGLHFALSRPNILYADLDGHLDIIDDPFDGMLKIVNGIILPPEGPGLGWGKLKKIGL